MDEHRPGWRTLPPDEIEEVMKDVATSLGAPDGSPEIARAAHDLAVRQEATNLATFWVEKLDAAEAPGIERAVPGEVRARIFIDAIEERYGGMTPLAAEVCKLLRSEHMRYEPREDRLLN